MAAEVGEEFVTIVPVGEARAPAREPAFVTVLTVGAAAGAEVLVRRPRAARLGLGLKFEGGSAAAEKVRRLLVQSCAEDSPAANAQAPWGKLIPGDEILAIDGVSVSDLTRIDCVRRLKDSDEILKLLVRHIDTEDNTEENGVDATDSVTITKTAKEIVRPTTLPPPVPPRKLGKKNSFKDKTLLQTVGEQNGGINSDNHKSTTNDKINGQTNGISTFTKLSRKSSFDSHILRQNKEGIACLKRGSPEEVRRLVRRLSDGKTMPPEAEVYIDLLSNEWEKCLLLADAESDDTGSSISTVVDRLGSMASSVENSIPSTPIMQPKTIDIQKVLNCIENIDSNILRDITTNNFLDKHCVENETKPQDKNISTNGLQESTQIISLVSEEIITKKTTVNDKNNNTTIIQNGTSDLETNQICQIDVKVNKKPELEKPKPMPRSTKVERSASDKKPRPIPVPQSPPPPVPDTLLTPTKKNCIESWLQRSEAEMNCPVVEKLEEVAIPEALPRLIDFVPKPQYKERGGEAPALARPTTAPPPPPAEPREDGSGASLDTIGELDETSYVAENRKEILLENDKKERKPFERSYWEDRMNKSDIEDKSLSNDETPLPTCPRQPPDGVETPSDVVEKIPEPPARLPPRLPPGWAPRPRLSYTSRTQDARSEASVKDKIAMFSNDHSVSTDRLEKCGTLPTRNQTSTKKNTPSYMGSYTDVSSLDRRLTKSQDNLDELPRSYKRQSERPEVLGATESVPSPTLGGMKSSRATISESKPLFYGSTNTLPSKDITFNHMRPTVQHTRSVSDDNGNKNYKSNLEYLIEQRKKSMSKLRGLVIPETRAPVVDLPEIKVQDSLSKSFQMPVFNKSSSNRKEEKPNSTKPIILNESKWKTNLLSNNIPKYSPAFKRKSLQVYSISCLSKESTPERKFNEKLDILAKANTLGDYKVSRNGLDSKNVSVHKYTSTLPTKFSSTNRYLCKDFKHILNDDVKVCTITDVVDSDNDSAMSSTQSSYRSSASSPMHTVDTLESDSSRLSPRISHYTTYSLVKTEIPAKSSILEKNCEEYTKRNVCRSVSSDTNVSLSSSAGSAATSGSQASCSSLESSINDSEKRKVIKTYNIDTINRRNILASAKCRSGRDAKLKSPVVETKFSHEPQDEPSSPPPKASDRLSTLTSSVSAMSNKGESRRRNKVIADTDSDSDSEINVRQRKPEFKNTRLKRSLSNKNKQSDTVDSPKVDDPPKIAPEKNLKENKKIVLDTTGTKASLLEKIQIETKKTEHLLKRKEDLVPKQASYTQKKDLILNHSEKTVPSVKQNANVLKTIPNGKTNGNHVDDNKVTTQTIRLRRGVASGVGLILAGGADCEAKDVTVHRVLADSIAAKAGLKRGVKVRSINGRAMKGLTHAQSVSILKEQRTEVVIEVENETHKIANGPHYGSENAESVARNGTKKASAAEPVVTVLVEKAGGGAGLGFGLDGGKDSPSGDRPLTIKKLFAGGAAAQSGRVLVGATLLSAGGTSMEGFTRTQAWAALKALPPGPVSLVLRNPKTN